MVVALPPGRGLSPLEIRVEDFHREHLRRRFRETCRKCEAEVMRKLGSSLVVLIALMALMALMALIALIACVAVLMLSQSHHVISQQQRQRRRL